MIKIIKELPKNEASPFKDILVKIILNSVFSRSHENFQSLHKKWKFPWYSEVCDITPVFKKGDAADKSNYRPLSTLSNFWKIFEKLIYTHSNSFMELRLLKYIGGFRKNHKNQHALLKMNETWGIMRNKGKKLEEW